MKNTGKDGLIDLDGHLAQQTLCFLMLEGILMSGLDYWNAHSAFSAVSLKSPHYPTTGREQVRQRVRLKTDFSYVTKAPKLLLEEE